MVAAAGRSLIVALSLGAVIVCPAPAAGQVAPLDPPEVARTASALSGRLDGLVTDHLGTPLAGAAVTAQGASLLFAVSDEHGRFSFYGLKPGPYLVRAVLPGYVTSKRELVQVLPAHPAWQAFRLSRSGSAGTALAERPVLDASLSGDAGEDTHDHGAVAWRLRHLKRSVLRDEGQTVIDLADSADDLDTWLAGRELDRLASPGAAAYAAGQTGWLPGLSLNGQVQLLTSSSFDTPQELFSSATLPAGIAYFSIGSAIGRSGHWSAQAAIAQGDLSSWTFAGAYATDIAGRHSLDVTVAYGLQRYEGPDPLALDAVAGGNRDAGAVSVTDRWSFAENASLTAGTRLARYGYIDGASMWSPSASLRWSPVDRTSLRFSATQVMSAPGAEEFVPSPVGGLWLPSQRTFSSAVAGAPFRPSRTQQIEVAVDREIGAFLLSARGFGQQVREQIVTLFGMRVEGQPRADLGHYMVANAGDVASYGWGVGLSRPVASRLRGGVSYTLTQAQWSASPDLVVLARTAPSVLRGGSERVHDITTTLETEIPQVETRVFAVYRLSSGFARAAVTEFEPGFAARFEVQVAQPLRFLDFTSAEWEALVAVRNLFRETVDGMSVYDELLVVRPPKRIVGGLLVRF
jgi:outer membrane receptor protein involved in Fe transport